MQLSDQKNLKLYSLLIIAVFLNVSLWLHSHNIYIKWTNVPPAPKIASAHASFLGDDEFSFRAWALALQNYGSVGQAQPFKDYNYQLLEDWFFLLDKLDPHSRFVPRLAAYYYSSTQDPAQIPHLIKYLEAVGMRPGYRNWEWLAQAAYLARHRMNNLNEALRIAKEMADIYMPGMPLWVRNMEPMLKSDMGDWQTAYGLALETLKTDGPQMSASEYTSTITMICESILPKSEAAKNQLCQKN